MISSKFSFIIKRFCVFVTTMLIISFIGWTLDNIYYRYCYDSSFIGIVSNLITMMHPVCNTIKRWSVNLSDIYIQWWTAIALTGCNAISCYFYSPKVNTK